MGRHLEVARPQWEKEQIGKEEEKNSISAEAPIKLKWLLSF